MDIPFRYIHVLSFILLCGSLMAENILILLVALTIPLLAVMMAKGIGLR